MDAEVTAVNRFATSRTKDRSLVVVGLAPSGERVRYRIVEDDPMLGPLPDPFTFPTLEAAEQHICWLCSSVPCDAPATALRVVAERW